MIRLFRLLVLTTLLISCNTEGFENNEQNQQNIESWNMFRQWGLNIMVWPEPGEVVWKLNLNTNILSIANNHPDVWYPSGEYNFQKSQDSLFVDFIEFQRTFVISFEGEELWIGNVPTPSTDSTVLHGFKVEE